MESVSSTTLDDVAKVTTLPCSTTSTDLGYMPQNEVDELNMLMNKIQRRTTHFKSIKQRRVKNKQASKSRAKNRKR